MIWFIRDQITCQPVVTFNEIFNDRWFFCIAYFLFFLNYALYKKLKFESIKTILEQISYNVTYVYI